MEEFSVNEILEQAIQTENLGHQFYTAMAERFKNDDELRKLFLTLASKEMEHRELFSCIKSEAERVVPLPVDWEEVSHYMRAIVESEFFLGNKKNLSGMSEINTIKEAVRFAIGFEKDTLLYFIGLRDVVAQKDPVDKIISEERSHIKWLSIYNDTLSNCGE
jgi:rubrerythrin